MMELLRMFVETVIYVFVIMVMLLFGTMFMRDHMGNDHHKGVEIKVVPESTPQAPQYILTPERSA